MAIPGATLEEPERIAIRTLGIAWTTLVRRRRLVSHVDSSESRPYPKSAPCPMTSRAYGSRRAAPEGSRTSTSSNLAKRPNSRSSVSSSIRSVAAVPSGALERPSRL